MKEKAIEWYEHLSNIEAIALERKYGYYGHDQGITADEILFMYKEELGIL